MPSGIKFRAAHTQMIKYKLSVQPEPAPYEVHTRFSSIKRFIGPWTGAFRCCPSAGFTRMDSIVPNGAALHFTEFQESSRRGRFASRYSFPGNKTNAMQPGVSLPGRDVSHRYHEAALPLPVIPAGLAPRIIGREGRAQSFSI